MVTNEVQILTCSFDASDKEDPIFPIESKVSELEVNYGNDLNGLSLYFIIMVVIPVKNILMQ